MKAAVLYEVNKPLVIEDVSLQKPGPREVLIRTAVAGLCHSDLHFMEGLYPHPLPAVLGHEFAGVVEQVGSDVTYVKPGDHVVTCLSVFCGTCDNCTTGRPVLCTDTTVKMLPGVSNRLSWARSEKLQPVPQPVVLRRADAGARERHRQNPQGHAARSRRADRLRRHHRLRRGGEHRQGRARRERGGDRLRRRRHGRDQRRRRSPAPAASSRSTPIRPSCSSRPSSAPPTSSIPANGDVVQQVRELTKGGVHHSFEVLGRKETAEQAFAMLAPGGTATIVGMIPFGQKIELHGFDFLRERKIQGSSMGSNHFRVDMPRLVEFYMRGRLHLEDWISAKLKLSEINEGFAAMKAGKTVRSVIMFDA